MTTRRRATIEESAFELLTYSPSELIEWATDANRWQEEQYVRTQAYWSAKRRRVRWRAVLLLVIANNPAAFMPQFDTT